RSDEVDRSGFEVLRIQERPLCGRGDGALRGDQEVRSRKYEVCERRNRRDRRDSKLLCDSSALCQLSYFRLRTSNLRLSLRSLEPSHQHSLSEDVSVDRFQHVGARRVGTEIELRVERVQLPGVVMIRSDVRR